MAAKAVLIPYDFNKNELRNALFHLLASAPGSPVEGQEYYDTTLHQFLYYNGSAWVNKATDSALLNGQAGSYYLSRANHTGTQLSSTISDFTTAVQALQWRSMTAPTSAVNMASQNFSSLAASTTAGQAVEYAQWQAAIAAQQSGLDFKATPATVVTTSNITLTAPGATLSGHTMVSGDSFLAVGQTTTTQNGLYTWNGASSTATRRADANSAGSIYSGTMVAVTGADATYPDTVWMQTTVGTGANGSSTIGTDVETWIRPFSTTVYTFSNGLLNTAGTITVLADPVTNGGIIVSASGVKVDSTLITMKKTFNVGDGSSTSYTLNHNLGTRDVEVQVYLNSGTYATIECDVQRTDGNNVAVIFSVAPASNAYRAVIQG